MSSQSARFVVRGMRPFPKVAGNWLKPRECGCGAAGSLRLHLYSTMVPLIHEKSIDSLKAVVGIAGVRRLAVRFEAHLLPRLDHFVGMSGAELKLEAHSLRGSALLLGMSALAEELRAVEDSGQWGGSGQAMRDLSERTISELWRILDG